LPRGCFNAMLSRAREEYLSDLSGLTTVRFFEGLAKVEVKLFGFTAVFFRKSDREMARERNEQGQGSFIPIFYLKAMRSKAGQVLRAKS